MTEPMLTSPMIAGQTADAYAAALKALAAAARTFLDEDDADSLSLYRHARALDDELRQHDLQPRRRLTRTEVHHNALKRFIRAVYEFDELKDHDGGELGLRVWDAFDREVSSAARHAESYGPGDTTWAPEDETNPLKTTPIPTPDPSADPVAEGIRQGDWVRSDEESPRQVLTGIEDGPLGPSVRLSDPRDGTWFGGFHIQPSMLGTVWVKVDPPAGELVREGTAAS